MPGSFGLLLERIEQCQQETGKWGKHWSLVEIASAIPDLRVCTNYLRWRQNQRRREQDHLQQKQPKVLLGSLHFKLKPLKQIESILLLALTF